MKFFAAIAIAAMLFLLMLKQRERQVRADDSPAIASLCQLQRTAEQGSHISVRGSGIFSEGIDMGVLTDSACPTVYTWAELALKSDQNRNKFAQTLKKSGHAQVVFSGEFYGPPAPDSHLPDSVRKSYHPGWGTLRSVPNEAGGLSDRVSRVKSVVKSPYSK